MHDSANCTVVQSDEHWAVVCGEHIVADGFKSNASAWRWIDRQNGEPISRAEHVVEWINKKELLPR